MSEQARPYRENLFQWIWQQLEFDCQNLSTVCGKELSIADPGKLNHAGGPDFLGAHIVANGLHWHGSVEIHKTSADWHAHNHGKDKNFDSVILHVVFQDNAKIPATTSDGSTPMVLVLKPYLHKSLNHLLSLKQTDGLPCGGSVAFINQDAFNKQIEEAHKEYFEYKVKELLQEYNPSLRMSQAWREMLIIQVYKTLGIPANRLQMGEFAKWLLGKNYQANTADEFVEFAYARAFSEKSEAGITIHWNHSGMRPASRPRKRVGQAAAWHYAISRLSFKKFLNEPEQSWKDILSAVPAGKVPGKSRMQIIKNTVYFPAVYLLGDILQSESLKTEAFSRWQKASQIVPEEVRKPFKKAGFELSGLNKKLGLAHQYKRYCLQRNCHRCKVFKSSIGS